MKKTTLSKKSINRFLITLFISAIVSSCGGGSSLPKNEIIGDVPAVLTEYHNSIANMEKEAKKAAEKLQGNDDQNVWMKMMTEFKEKEDAIEKKKDLAIKKALETLKDRELPVINSNPDIEVKNLKIDFIKDSSIGFKGIVDVKKPHKEDHVKCRFVDKDGNTIQEYIAIMDYFKQSNSDHVPVGERSIRTEIEIEGNPETARLAKIEILP